MSIDIDYLVEDVEKFLIINEKEGKKEQSKSLKKLLSVQNKIKIFKNIDPVELKAIVYDLKFQRNKQKDYIIKQDQEESEIYFLIDGECQVFYNTTKTGTIKPGEVFGEAGAIFGTKRNATVVCSSKEATLLSFKIDSQNLEFCANALATLYKNLAFEINKKLESLNSLVATKKK